MTPPTCPDTPTRRQLLSTTVAATTLALAGCNGNSDYSVDWDTRSESRDDWDYATVYGTVTNNSDFGFGVEIVATFNWETLETEERTLVLLEPEGEQRFSIEDSAPESFRNATVSSRQRD